MFRRAPPRRHPRPAVLSLQPLERRLPMAGDMTFTFSQDAPAIKGDEGQPAEVAKFEERLVIAPSYGIVKAIDTGSNGDHVSRLVDVQEKMEGLLAVKQAEDAGMDRDLERESRFVDPATGEPLDVGRKSASALDSGLGGWGGSDPLGDGKSSAATDPLTGRPLLGGSGGDGASPSQADMLAAARGGKSRAMDDSNVVTDKTLVQGAMTFGEAYISTVNDPSGATYTRDDGTTVNITAGQSEDGTRYVWVTHERKGEEPAHVIYYEGGSIFGNDDKKPRPDDDSGTPPRQLTEAEKLAVLQELRSGFGSAGKPRPDDDGAQPSGAVGEVLTYLDLAGQPRLDDEGHGGGAAPKGPVLTGLGLAGQPVDDDPNFGVVSLQVGGPQPLNPVFGGGLVLDNAVTDRIEEGLDA